MQQPLTEAKAILRQEIASRIAAMPAEEKQQMSRVACQLLQRSRVWRDASAVLLYAPLPDELDLWPLASAALQSGKKLALPAFQATSACYGVVQVANLETDLVRGRYGIREPGAHCVALALNPLDLVLVPGIAFDLDGRRLGRGKGYYDRLLLQTRAKKCGAAFDPQIVPQVPVGPHDIYLDCILTPTRWIEC